MRILIAEDDSDFRVWLQRNATVALEEAGLKDATWRICSNYREATDAIESEPWDLAILDLNFHSQMPRSVVGFELAVNACERDIQTIVVTQVESRPRELISELRDRGVRFVYDKEEGTGRPLIENILAIVQEMSEEWFDAFVSYSHKDGDWVKGTLIPRLEKANLRVGCDDTSFRPGMAITDSIKQTLSRSRFVILVVTEDWVRSSWTQYEYALGDQKLVPLLLSQDVELPGPLRSLVGIDFSESAREDGFRRLLDFLAAPGRRG